MGISVTRYHDISLAHRAVGDGGKCEKLHGHNYRIHFTCTIAHNAKLTNAGRVVDFDVIKSVLCAYVERMWDHHLLLWGQDPLWREYIELVAANSLSDTWTHVLSNSIVVVPFNTSTENMAQFLLEHGAKLLIPYPGVVLCRVHIEETRKCSATAELGVLS